METFEDYLKEARNDFFAKINEVIDTEFSAKKVKQKSIY